MNKIIKTGLVFVALMSVSSCVDTSTSVNEDTSSSSVVTVADQCKDVLTSTTLKDSVISMLTNDGCDLTNQDVCDLVIPSNSDVVTFVCPSNGDTLTYVLPVTTTSSSSSLDISSSSVEPIDLKSLEISEFKFGSNRTAIPIKVFAMNSTKDTIEFNTFGTMNSYTTMGSDTISTIVQYNFPEVTDVSALKTISFTASGTVSDNSNTGNLVEVCIIDKSIVSDGSGWEQIKDVNDSSIGTAFGGVCFKQQITSTKTNYTIALPDSFTYQNYKDKLGISRNIPRLESQYWEFTPSSINSNGDPIKPNYVFNRYWDMVRKNAIGIQIRSGWVDANVIIHQVITDVEFK